MALWTWNGKIIVTDTGALAGDSNCCCEEDLCPCLTGPLKDPIIGTWTIPPLVGTLNVPCQYDPDTFFSPVEICNWSACVNRGRFCDHARWTVPGECEPMFDSCERFQTPEFNCCEIRPLSVPNLGWGGNPALCDCVPPLGGLCADGSINDFSTCYEFQLTVNCSDPNNIRSTLFLNVSGGCSPIDGIAQWTKDHGPGPIDPALVLGTYTMTPGGNFQPPPLPAIPYGSLQFLAGLLHDFTGGWVVTLS